MPNESNSPIPNSYNCWPRADVLYAYDVSPLFWIQPVYYDERRYISTDQTLQENSTSNTTETMPLETTPVTSSERTFAEYLEFYKEGKEHVDQYSKGYIYIGNGDATNPLSRFWGGRNVFSASLINGSNGHKPQYCYYVKKSLWYSSLYTEMFSRSDKSIIGRYNTKIKNGLLSANTGVIEINSKIPNHTFVWCVDKQSLIPADFVYTDPSTGYGYATDKDFVRIVNSLSSTGHVIHGFWHRDSVTSARKTFYCEHSCAYYNRVNFTPVRVIGRGIDIKIVCYDIYKDSIFEWNDGTYHWESQWGNIAEYHSTNRPWLDAGNRDRFTDEERLRVGVDMGVELEIYCKSTDARGKFASELPKDHIFGETDGSLDRQKGIELVGKPYTYSDYINGKTEWNKVITTAVEAGSIGFNPPDNRNYGMHVSISRHAFPSTFHLAKFVVFFNMQESLCKLIAQRDIIYSGAYKIRQKIVNTANTDRKAPALYVDTAYNKKHARRYVFDTNKYEAVSVQQKRVEVRIFRSNLSWERFLKNIEFCDAVRAFTIDASAADVANEATGTPKFLEWLFRRNDYASLRKFLEEKVYKKELLIANTGKHITVRTPQLKDKIIENI